VLLLVDKGNSCLSARRAGLLGRLVVRVHAARLDHDLAEGASPDITEALALRAQMLVRPSMRRDLAGSLEEILALATEATAWPYLPVAPCCDRVRAAAEEFHLLIDRLYSPGPVPAQGVARTSVLLSDGSGPLYHRGNHDDLSARVRDAAEALDPLTTW
jgi:hypothetical protein